MNPPSDCLNQSIGVQCGFRAPTGPATSFVEPSDTLRHKCFRLKAGPKHDGCLRMKRTQRASLRVTCGAEGLPISASKAHSPRPASDVKDPRPVSDVKDGEPRCKGACGRRTNGLPRSSTQAKQHRTYDNNGRLENVNHLQNGNSLDDRSIEVKTPDVPGEYREHFDCRSRSIRSGGQSRVQVGRTRCKF